MNKYTPYITLFALCLVLFFWKLGATPLIGLDEGLYSECSREMLATGDYLVPMCGGQPFFEKPPLCYWLQAGSMKLFGVNSFAARFPSASASLFLVCWVVFLGTRLFDRRAGLSAGFMLATSMLMVGVGRMSLLDSVFSLIIAVSLGAFILAFTGRWPSWTYLLFWAAAGLTTLVKGPAGAIIIFAVAGAFLLIRRYNLTPNPSPRGRGEPSSPSPWEGVRGRFAIGILVFFAVALPWYVMVERGTHGAFLQEFIIHQNIQRALGKDFQHNGPFYYYIPIYLAGFFPWSVFIPLAWKKHVSRKPKDIPEEAALFFGVWAVCAFVVFSIFRSKLPHYILPVFVPSALIVGLLLSREIEKRSMKKCAVAVLVTSVLIGVALQVGQTFIPTPVPGLSFPLLIMSVAIIAGSIIAFALILAERFAAAFVALCAGVTAFLVVAFGLGLPAYASFASVPMVAIAQKLGRVVPENAAVVAYRLSPPQPAISFYAQHPVRMAATPEELDSIMASDKVEFIVGQNDRLQCLPSSAKQVTSAGKYILFRIAGRRD